MGNQADGDVGILAEQIIKRSAELKYVYQILMLVDEESEPDLEKRIYRAFNFSEKTDEERAMIESNMKIFDAYFLGGLEVMHEEFVEKCVDRDTYLQRMYEFTKNFNDEQDNEKLQTEINKILNL